MRNLQIERVIKKNGSSSVSDSDPLESEVSKLKVVTQKK